MLTIKEFFALDDLILARWGRKAYHHVDYCGLNPIRPLQNWDYAHTPTNTLSFAQTGGDGVHFGLLNARDETAIGPVVMTVPMAGVNIVVAETLEEFFGIGCRTGWSELEQLAYDASEIIAHYAGEPEDLSTEERTFLDMVRSELHVELVALTPERLAELEQRFQSQLQIKPSDDVA